tara:strand:- start:713 stop:1360 length:648 start_codon:yes stop_codon:yes gene_type:complete
MGGRVRNRAIIDLTDADDVMGQMRVGRRKIIDLTDEEDVMHVRRVRQRKIIDLTTDDDVAPRGVGGDGGHKEPENFVLCPISLHVMSDPVVAEDGHTYERCKIESWFGWKLCSPKNNTVLTTPVVVPNNNLRMAIERLQAGESWDASKIVPEYLVCPRSGKIMKDPVVAADGNSYEKEFAGQYVYANNNLYQLIEDFVHKNIPPPPASCVEKALA